MEAGQFKASWVNPKLAKDLKNLGGAAEASTIEAGPFIPGYVQLPVGQPDPGTSCEGEHHFFVAETGTVEQEGKVCCIIICTSCGSSKLITYQVTGGVKLQNKKG